MNTNVNYQQSTEQKERKKKQRLFSAELLQCRDFQPTLQTLPIFRLYIAIPLKNLPIFMKLPILPTTKQKAQRFFCGHRNSEIKHS